MVRDAVREMEQTRRHKEESTVTVYRATPEQIDKMLGGKDMGRPAGSKNKARLNDKSEVTAKQDEKEVNITANNLEANTNPTEKLLEKEVSETIPDHMKDFKELIRMKHRVACQFALKYKIESELKEAQSDNTFQESVCRIIDYCEETLKQFKKDL